MAQLKELQKKVPTADVVAGRVIAYHKGKHIDLGEYVGDGLVSLTKEGQDLMVPLKKETESLKDLDVNIDDLAI
jgi:hypothetical protein